MNGKSHSPTVRLSIAGFAIIAAFAVAAGLFAERGQGPPSVVAGAPEVPPPLTQIPPTATPFRGCGVGSAIASTDASADVYLACFNIPRPGLGAWTVDVTYDPDVVAVEDCETAGLDEGSESCDPAFGPDTIRFQGDMLIDAANASGFAGGLRLGDITFRCLSVGSSPLTVAVHELTDATPGGQLGQGPRTALSSVRSRHASSSQWTAN